MNKEEFLKQFIDKDLASKVYNTLNICLEYGIVANTEMFLTPNIWKKISSEYFGIKVEMRGYDRKQICFYPKDSIPLFEYDILKIVVDNKFKEYTHKDFLGSIMSLNIKRELIGDLFIEEGVAFVFVASSISEYIENNLLEIGKNKCIINKVEERNFEYKFSSFNVTIASNRLDVLVSEITNLSRSKSVEYIESGLVQIDYDVCKNKNEKIESGMIITIRKYGKFILQAEMGESKKGKKKWEVKKYV